MTSDTVRWVDGHPGVRWDSLRELNTNDATNRSMPDPSRTLAGDCTVTDGDSDETRRERGSVVALCTPDNCREPLVDLHSPEQEGRCTTEMWANPPDICHSWPAGYRAPVDHSGWNVLAGYNRQNVLDRIRGSS